MRSLNQFWNNSAWINRSYGKNSFITSLIDYLSPQTTFTLNRKSVSHLAERTVNSLISLHFESYNISLSNPFLQPKTIFSNFFLPSFCGENEKLKVVLVRYECRFVISSISNFIKRLRFVSMKRVVKIISIVTHIRKN